ncbi:MAG: hypothetical protein Q7V58_12185 [Actinomycetota bacterium]|nr:hypothetical protein [Actinomycetota bacterium]
MSADLTTVVAMTPSWCRWRPLFQAMSPTPPTTWATIAAVSTGENLCQESTWTCSVTAAWVFPPLDGFS